MTGRQTRSLYGVNCLYAVNRYYGITIPYEDISALLSPSDWGVSMSKLVKIAESIGYRTRVLKARVEDWLKFSSPLIVWIRSERNSAIGHFIVAIPDKEGRRVWWLDPPNPGK